MGWQRDDDVRRIGKPAKPIMRFLINNRSVREVENYQDEHLGNLIRAWEAAFGPSRIFGNRPQLDQIQDCEQDTRAVGDAQGDCSQERSEILMSTQVCHQPYMVRSLDLRLDGMSKSIDVLVSASLLHTITDAI